MKKYLRISLALVSLVAVLAFSGCKFWEKKDDAMTKKENGAMMEKKDDAMMEDDGANMEAATTTAEVKSTMRVVSSKK